VLRLTFKSAGLVLLAYFLLFHGLADVGLLGPDEPRYASIGREMELTADWVTPRLWGDAWFEKPALLYWMTAAGFWAGLGDDLAPRLPVAVFSLLFLIFFQRFLARQLGSREAWYATAILATSAGWIAFSRLCATDLPLSASFGASLILLMGWIERGDRRLLLPAGVCLGIAILAKGLVPVVLAAPLVWYGRRRIKDLIAYGGFAALTAAPWYVLCALENGRPFLEEFFWRHQFARFYTSELQHVQPFWFYLPVLAAGLVPWAPALVLLARRHLWREPKTQYLLVTALFGLVFFSASTNKLPGYLLPLFPLLAVGMGTGLARAGRAGAVLAGSAALLGVIPVAAAVLPVALRQGLSRAGWAGIDWPVLGLVAPVVLAAFLLDRRQQRSAAVTLVATGAAAGVLYLVVVAFPVLDESVSARGLWREIEPNSDRVCVEPIHRTVRYGLNFYSMEPLPACADKDRPIHVKQKPGGPVYLEMRSGPATSFPLP